MLKEKNVEVSQEKTPSTKALRSWLLVTLCLLVVFALAAASLGVMFSLTVKEHQAESAVALSQMEELEARLADLETQHSATVSSMEADVSQKNEEIARQQQEIDSLKKQIEELKKVTTTYGPQKTTVAVNTADTGKLVALTFDDGPNSETTAQLLDAMKQRGVRATFFVLGSRINDSTVPLLQRMVAEGHVVGNHSQNHKNLRYQSVAGIKAEMDASANRIKEATGHYPVVMRAPGGNLNSKVKSYAQNAGVSIIQWSVDTRDWESKNVDSIFNTAFYNGYSTIKNGSIVLMHDIYPTTVEASIKIMDKLLAEGYTMVTVPELLTLREGGAIAGEVYSSAA